MPALEYKPSSLTAKLCLHSNRPKGVNTDSRLFFKRTASYHFNQVNSKKKSTQPFGCMLSSDSIRCLVDLFKAHIHFLIFLEIF